MITGILGSIGVVIFADAFLMQQKWIKIIGKKTLGIMALHYPLVQIIFHNSVNMTNNRTQQILTSLAMLGLGIILLITFLLTKALEHYVPWLIGKKHVRPNKNEKQLF